MISTDRKRLGLLLLIMTGTLVAVGGVAIYQLYQTELRDKQGRLTELAQAQARLIEAVGRYDAAHMSSQEDTLAQVKDAHQQIAEMGETGEFALARREGDSIVFLLNHRHKTAVERQPIPFDSTLAEPMRRALSGEAGWVVGLDYRGAVVLAAHQPIRGLNWGLVAKIDLHEIRKPFIQTAILIMGVGLVLVIGGAVLFLRLTNPVIRQLHESEERFERAVRGTSDGLWEWNILTNEEWFAPRFLELLGYDYGELPEKYDAWESRLHPDDRDRTLEAVRLHLEQDHPFDIEYRLRTKSGDYCWFRARGIAYRDESGKPTRMAGSIQDITIRKRAEEALHRFEHIVSSSTDMLALLDKNCVYLAVNQAYLNAFGKVSDDLIGHTVAEVFGEEFFGTTIRPNAERCLAGAEVRYQTWIEFPVTGLQYMDIAYFPYLGPDKEVRGFVVNARNITKRKRAEEALRRSDLELFAIYENAPVVMLLVDRKRRIRKTNAHSAAMTGRSQKELIGLSCGKALRCIHAHDDPRGCGMGPSCEACGVRNAVLETFRTGQARFAVEASIPCELVDGPADVWVLLSTALLKVSEEDLVLVCMEDITERKQMEEEVRLQQAELVRISRLSTMGEMASGIAHELNQPLSAIMTYTETCRMDLQAGKVNREQLSDDLEHVTSLAERIGETVERLRNFVRKRETQRAPANVNRLVEDVVSFVEHELRLSEVKVRSELAPRLPAVLVDGIQIQQVLLNLVRNAMEAMSEVPVGQRELMVQTSMATGDAVEVVVRDTGPGVGSTAIDRLFEPFYTSKPEGLGVGLSISRSIIEAHGSRLLATANPEGGMTFQFTLPVFKIGKDDESSKHCVRSG